MGDHQGFKIHVKGDPARAYDKRGGEPSNSGETKTVVRWSPYNYAPQPQSTSPSPSTRAKSTTHGPCHGSEAGPQGAGSSGCHRPPQRLTANHHNHRSPAASAYRSPRPHQHPQRARGHLRPHQGPHTTSHALAAPRRRRAPCVPGTGPPQGGPARISTDPRPGGEKIQRPLATRSAPLSEDIGHRACPPRPRSGRPPRCVRMRGAWMVATSATHARPIRGAPKSFLHALSVTYRRLPLLAPTIIIGDLNAARTNDVRTGHPLPPTLPSGMPCTNWASPTSQQDSPAHPPTTSTRPAPNPPRMDTCCRDPSTVRVHVATYGYLPRAGTRH